MSVRVWAVRCTVFLLVAAGVVGGVSWLTGRSTAGSWGSGREGARGSGDKRSVRPSGNNTTRPSAAATPPDDVRSATKPPIVPQTEAPATASSTYSSSNVSSAPVPPALPPNPPFSFQLPTPKVVPSRGLVDIPPPENAPADVDTKWEQYVTASSLVPANGVLSYVHPYDNCQHKALEFTKVRKVYVNGTRLWPDFPDRRLMFHSEHERCHAVLARMLAIFTVVVKEYNMQDGWFISHGTLLGAARHGGMIPWDVDVDIAMKERYMRRLATIWDREFPRDMLLQTHSTDPGFSYTTGSNHDVYRIVDRYSTYKKYPFPKKGRSTLYYHVGPQIDLIPAWSKGSAKVILGTYIGAQKLYPPTSICFESFVVNAPNQPIEVLKRFYGANVSRWMEKPKAGSEYQNQGFGQGAKCAATTISRNSKWALDYRYDRRRNKTSGNRPVFGCIFGRKTKRFVCRTNKNHTMYD